MDGMKTCTLCGEMKPFSEFTKHRQMKDGLSYWCRECNNKRTKAFRESPSGIYTNIKGRSTYYKAKGSKFYKPINISREEFIVWYTTQERKCVYCDLPEKYLYLMKEDFNGRVSRLEVDCMDNNRGYEIGNMVLACHRCNFIKLNFLTFEEMRFIGQKFLKPKWEAKVRVSKGEE